MGSIISAIYDDIKLHGSVEAAQAWRDRKEIAYIPDPESDTSYQCSVSTQQKESDNKSSI